MREQWTEADLELLIDQQLQDCKGYENICALIGTPIGKKRVIERVKEILYNDGIEDIAAALAQIETDQRFADNETPG